MTKIRSITKYYKISWNDLSPYRQSSHEAELHWSVESTRSTAGKESIIIIIIIIIGEYYYTSWVNIKQDTKLFPITSPNVNRFSKFFQGQTQW